MKKIFALTLILIFVPASSFAFKINLWGVDVTKDFSITQLALGIIASHATHELGHYTTAKIFDAEPELHINKVVYHKRMNKTQRLWTSRSGYLAQNIVGSLLTLCPKTRGTDFTTAFTGHTAINSFGYAITGGIQGKQSSDTRNISANGGKGKTEFVASGIFSSGLTYINLKN